MKLFEAERPTLTLTLTLIAAEALRARAAASRCHLLAMDSLPSAPHQAGSLSSGLLVGTQLECAFLSADVDQSGCLNAAELHRTLTLLGSTVTIEEAVELHQVGPNAQAGRC